MKKTIEKYLQASDEVSFKVNKAGAKIWYRAHAIIETGVIDTGKANGWCWSCDHDIKINRFQAALILEKYGLTIDQFIDAEKEFYATYYPEETNINEADSDDYAVNPDALEVAVNAEIQNANTAKINDLKWEIRYTEGSINDLDKNHIAHAPNDQSLQERRTELVNELDNLKAQLAELLPNEPNTNSEYKYYLQSRRPIAGAVPNGYISATQGDMKAHSLRSDGSISPVPRKVVFGEVVYDHPLSDQQIINYDLHVDPLNPKVEPDTTELSDQEVAEIKRRSQINAIKSRIATYERAIERQYDQELENSLIEAKAQLADLLPNEILQTGKMVSPEPNTDPEVDPIIQERDTARNEYEEINQVRRLIEKDCERYERLRNRCKPNSPKHKEYNQLLADFDPIIRAFGEKFIAAQDRYNKSLTLRTDEEIAATQKAIDEHNADLDARGIKYFATVYYYPNGIEGEDMETFHKDCTSLDEANAFISQEDHDGVYVGGIYDAGWEITDRNDNLVANHITGIKEEQPMTNREKLLALRKEYIITDRLSANNSSMWYVNGKRSSQVKVWNLLQEYGLTIAEFLAEDEAYINECIAASCKQIAIKKQADFYADKIKRDAQPSGDNVFDLLPDLDDLNDLSETDPYFMDDAAEYTERDARFNYGERYAAALTEKLSQYDPTVEVTYDIDDDDEDVYYLKFDGIYRSPYTLCGIESAFHRLKKDIAEEEFMKNVDGTLDDKIDALHQYRRKRKQVRDSINRAIKQCIRNRIGYLKSHNSKMEKYEYELLCLLQGARRELEVA